MLRLLLIFLVPILCIIFLVLGWGEALNQLVAAENETQAGVYFLGTGLLVSGLMFFWWLRLLDNDID